jgi:hypothetical protein
MIRWAPAVSALQIYNFCGGYYWRDRSTNFGVGHGRVSQRLTRSRYRNRHPQNGRAPFRALRQLGKSLTLTEFALSLSSTNRREPPHIVQYLSQFDGAPHASPG